MLKIVLSLLLVLILSGCFFAAKELVLDPDKGSLHAETMEVQK